MQARFKLGEQVLVGISRHLGTVTCIKHLPSGKRECILDVSGNGLVVKEMPTPDTYLYQVRGIRRDNQWLSERSLYPVTDPKAAKDFNHPYRRVGRTNINNPKKEYFAD